MASDTRRCAPSRGSPSLAVVGRHNRRPRSRHKVPSERVSGTGTALITSRDARPPSAIGIIFSPSIKSVPVGNLVRGKRKWRKQSTVPKRPIMGSSTWRTPADLRLSRKLQYPPRPTSISQAVSLKRKKGAKVGRAAAQRSQRSMKRSPACELSRRPN